jgi:molybdopterin-guanine dinucleotide biosynthesis protein
MPVPLLVVGGFRGAGKTTLVERAARLLGTEGLRVGIVTNDQAADPTYRYSAAVQP